LEQVKRENFEFKKALQQIHFIAIAIKFVTKIISDAFEILLPTQLFQYLDMKFNFSYNTNKQHKKIINTNKISKASLMIFVTNLIAIANKVDLLQGFFKLKKLPLNPFKIS
jgi:amino acid permease